MSNQEEKNTQTSQKPKASPRRKKAAKKATPKSDATSRAKTATQYLVTGKDGATEPLSTVRRFGVFDGVAKGAEQDARALAKDVRGMVITVTRNVETGEIVELDYGD